VRPTYPLVNGTLMNILETEYSVQPDRSLAAAKRLVGLCRKYGLDVVKASWVDGDAGLERNDPLSDALARVQEAENSGWTPWRPDA
jgi:hypothetical protein